MIQISILIIIVAFFLLNIIVVAANDSSIAAASVSTTKTNKQKHEHKHEHDDGLNNGLLGAVLIKLNDGNSIPQIGMGVALTGSKTYNSVIYALQHVGYRLFDTASEESYNNEDQVGNAIYDYNYDINRSNNCNDDYDDPNSGDASSSSDNNSNNNNTIFVTTKLWDTDHGFYNTIKAFMISYRELNLQNIENKHQHKQFKPIDLYLMHSPYGGRILETYDAMLYIQAQQQSQGKNPLLRSIGVSNFDIRHLEVIRINNRPMPTINQIEMHPLVYKQRKELIDYCHQHQIQIQAFGS
ncbi:Aldo/keto reductase [Fragilariopsis cylindrus CCMP1102]|uniref:Aldo/keto reductase n=1 Tax=Fragilariopsis cylindrus CCMP1102 TaxID=635003 RepID=A0A1E7EQW2_9STRA|nr:Aldo/keto reductase [Fragilariopsis cylindrus CCMP1102]|eukprot:OEU07943.1 Aldo/keto reductase [Fragilariopsis cylindrus CCMP1102]